MHTQHGRGLVVSFVKKSQLKNFSDMKTAGGCGVVLFWSGEYLFCQSATLYAFNVLVKKSLAVSNYVDVPLENCCRIKLSFSW